MTEADSQTPRRRPLHLLVANCNPPSHPVLSLFLPSYCPPASPLAVTLNVHLVMRYNMGG